MPQARPAPPRARRISWWLTPTLALALVVTSAACQAHSATGQLTPPNDAPAWESRYRHSFDDDYTREAINLQGRAPHDVRDQRLLAARMGYSHVIAQVKVLQVWGKGLYQGRQEQFLEVEIEQRLLGDLVKGTSEHQLVLVRAEDELPGSLQGQSLVMFLRWDPGESPPYHHHLMPVEAEAMAYIAALIKSAKAEGVIDQEGVIVEQSRRGRARRKRREQRGAAEVGGREGGG